MTRMKGYLIGPRDHCLFFPGARNRPRNDIVPKSLCTLVIAVDCSPILDETPKIKCDQVSSHKDEAIQQC